MIHPLIFFTYVFIINNYKQKIRRTYLKVMSFFKYMKFYNFYY